MKDINQMEVEELREEVQEYREEKAKREEEIKKFNNIIKYVSIGLSGFILGFVMGALSAFASNVIPAV